MGFMSSNSKEGFQINNHRELMHIYLLFVKYLEIAFKVQALYKLFSSKIKLHLSYILGYMLVYAVYAVYTVYTIEKFPIPNII